MSELLGRRTLLSSLIGAGVSLAALRTVDAGSSPDHDHQLQDLAKLLRSLERAGDQLEGIGEDWVPPVDPDVPAHAAALESIIVECQTILGGANLLLESLRAR